MEEKIMPDLTCHCGAVHIEVDAAPTEVTDCNCSICRRYGVLWAYYEITRVKFVSPQLATHVYIWGNKTIEFHRCKTCGCLTHGSPVDKSESEMGVNGRLFAPEILAKARIRLFDGANTWRYLDE
jgi:hypothetical protein